MTQTNAPGRSSNPQMVNSHLAENIPAKILVVDDDPTNRHIMVRTFGKMGYQIDQAEGALEAIAAIQKCAYDIVITDHHMGNVSGLEAVSKYREADAAWKSQRGRELFVAVLTACVESHDRERFLAAGMNEYLAKPIRPMALQELLERWHGGFCQAREQAVKPSSPSSAPVPAGQDAPSSPAVEVEITKPLGLSDQVTALLDLHTVLNMVNILTGEMHLLELHTGGKFSLQGAIQILESTREQMHAQISSDRLATALEQAEAIYLAELDELGKNAPDWRQAPEVRESVANLQSVFKIMRIRLAEFLARANTPDQWVAHDTEKLRLNFTEMFAAIEKNSKGRYHIVTNIAAQEIKDYMVDLKISSVEGRSITMPPVLQDVLRDLIANARKYTPPGGVVNAGMLRNSRELRLVVEDDGRGIPPDELEKVVEFGYRATNAQDVKTKGAGFGLTKAYWVARKFGGRMWIKSALGKGTRITIVLPVPAG